jgi:hypothetical protein
MLMAEDALKAIADKSVRPGRRLEALVERLTRCPPLLDQVIRLGEVWLHEPLQTSLLFIYLVNDDLSIRGH